MTLQLLCSILQHPKDEVHLFCLLTEMKPWLMNAVFSTTSVSYHILCRPWAQRWLDTSCLTPFVQLVSDRRNLSCGMSHVDKVTAERVGLLLVALQQACDSRLGNPLVLDPYWKPFVCKAECTLYNSRAARKKEKSVDIVRRRRGQPYTVKQRYYSEHLDWRIVTHHPTLLQSKAVARLSPDTNILCLRFIPATAFVKPSGEMLLVTEHKTDSVLDETSLHARYILAPYLETYFRSEPYDYSSLSFS